MKDHRTQEQTAIERLKEFEAEALALHPGGYYLACSGGKDSDVLLDLAKRSGVRFEAHDNLTTCDPPELVWHVKRMAAVADNHLVIDRPPVTMWQLVRKRQMPPLRTARYCGALGRKSTAGGATTGSAVPPQSGQAISESEHRLVGPASMDLYRDSWDPIMPALLRGLCATRLCPLSLRQAARANLRPEALAPAGGGVGAGRQIDMEG